MKKSRAALYGAVGAIVLAAGGVAYAAPDMMKGEMTKAEAQAKADEMFARMDVNGDGKLDDADREARLAKKFAELDKDGNGSISRAEFIAGHGKMDGHRMGHGGGGHGPDDKKGGHHGGMRDMMKDKADTNNDGAVSAAEFKAAHLAMFEKADANKDGKVTQDERRAAHKAMRDTMGQHQDH